MSANDRIYPLTRLVAGLVVPVLLLAFTILYFFPDQSGQRFAWAVKPNMTAIYIAAGYLGGAVQLGAVAVGKKWHRVRHGFLPITVFTTSMLVDTFLHWDTFDPGHFPFQLWLGLYIVTPFLVPFIWLRNRGEDPGGMEAGDRPVPAWPRRAMTLAGLVFAVFAAIGFFKPLVLIDIWVWKLSPLSAQLFAGWFALLAVGGILIGAEPRWSAWRVGLASIFTWHLLVAIGAFLNRPDFGSPGLLNWFIILVWIGLAGMAALFVYMEWGPGRSSS